MATLVSDPIRHIADQWENHCGYSSAVLSGIVPDSRHLDNGGYHCSVEDLRKYGNAGDYSNRRPDDKDKNTRYGAAIDMSLSPSDMKKSHDRMRKVWADTTDPRRKYLNAFNTWDGSGDAVRLDFYAGTAGYASPDHKWHDHNEVRRRYLLDMVAAKAIVSALKGETKQQYLASINPTKTPTVEASMTVTDDRVLQLSNAVFVGGDSMGLKVDPDGSGRLPESNSLVAKLDFIIRTLMLVQGEVSGDQQPIVNGVLAGLTPEKIAAAIPTTLAKQVADELTARLAE